MGEQEALGGLDLAGSIVMGLSGLSVSRWVEMVEASRGGKMVES